VTWQHHPTLLAHFRSRASLPIKGREKEKGRDPKIAA
jgi:hypothetical protein